MKARELILSHIYTDGDFYFQFIERHEKQFVFSVVAYDNGNVRLISPTFYARFSINGIKRLKEWKKNEV